MKKQFLLCILLCALTIAQPWAQEAGKGATPQVDERSLVINDTDDVPAADTATGQTGSLSTVSAWDFVKMILVLICVVAAIYGLFHVLRKMSGQKYPQNNILQVVSALQLPGKKSMYILRVGKEFYALGTAENSVTLLGRVEDKETIDEIILQETERPAVKQSFLEVFSRILRRRGDTEGLKSEDPEVFMKQQRDRLRRL
ncbi:MAG TPA: flagellar biosynthetic protein FliO [Spirochaetia bacterium]|nr:flagellar biosynthetic protein FliO [Spirochaetia bacterium]